jgi:hypothetical protein
VGTGSGHDRGADGGTVIRLLVRLYPRRWRDRYGDEFEELLESEGLRPAVVADVLLHALRARLDVRRHGVRAGVAALGVTLAEWFAYTHGYPNALWLPRSLQSAALLVMVLTGLVTIVDAVARLIAAGTSRRRVSA